MDNNQLLEWAKETGPKTSGEDAATAVAELKARWVGIAASARAAFEASDVEMRILAIMAIHAMRNFFSTAQQGDPHILVEAAECASATSGVDRNIHGDLLRFAGDAYVRREGGLEKAEEHYLVATAVYVQTGNTRFEASCRRGLGDVEFRLGNYPAAEEAWGKVIELNTSGSMEPDELMVANVERRLGNAAFVQHNFTDARAYYDNALARYRKIGVVADHPDCLVGLARLELATGHRGRALKFVNKAITLFERLGDKLGWSRALVLRSRIQRELGHRWRAAYSQTEAQALHDALGLAGEPEDVIR